MHEDRTHGETTDDRQELLRFAGLMAHQLKSPISSASSLLRIVLQEYAGPLTAQQRKTLGRTHVCLSESLRAMQRMLDIVRPQDDEERRHSQTRIGPCVDHVERSLRPVFQESSIALEVDVADQNARARATEAALTEVLNALLRNAAKYTPTHGRARLKVDRAPDGEMLRITVSDSGIGIPEENRERVFEPFFRTAAARASDRPGVGLGLAFVRSIIEQAGGSVRAADSDLGGAAIVLDIPGVPDEDPDLGDECNAEARFRVVIVGGVAAGPKTAAKTVRLDPEADVTIIEKGKVLSYAGCGLPYYVSGAVADEQELISTPVGVVRDLVFFQRVKNVHVRDSTEAMEVDRQWQRVRVRTLLDGHESWIPYDRLVLATGASPIVPPIPGIRRHGVFALHGVSDAEGIKASLASGVARDVVIIGGGLIGVEMTEALVGRGCRVTIVEQAPQVLHILDWEIARLVTRHMESKGVRVLTGTRATSIEAAADTPDRVGGVVTSRGTLPADMVILAAGVKPNVDLALRAGLDTSDTTGAIQVNDHMQTSDPNIYAVGDCVECRDLVTGLPCYVPLGSTASKQGRIAAVNLCGGDEAFPGVLGSTICKLFDYSVGRTGLTEREAADFGFDVITVLAPAPDRAHYMPTARMLLLKLVVETPTGRLLGAQVTGPGAVDKRIDVAAMAITAGLSVHQLANVDLCYAPPYSPAMDNIIAAANVARNKLAGHMTGISPVAVKAKLDALEDIVFLDVRTPAEVDRERLPRSINIPLASLRGRLGELSRDHEIITFCNISLRAYEAALILKANGFDGVKVMDGGIAMWPYEKA